MKHHFHLPGEIQVQGEVLKDLFGNNPSPEAVLRIREPLRKALEKYEENTGELPDLLKLRRELEKVIDKDPRELSSD